MKLASYNVENLFQRAVAMNQATWADGENPLALHAEMNQILGKIQYTAADKKRIVAIMKALKIDKADDGGDFAILRQNRGHLVKRPKAGGIEIVADGRGDWIGWLDLKVEAVNDFAVRNTARVIHDLDADVIGLVEAESRPALLRFGRDVSPAVGGAPYEHVMLIDGNDERGIDVAVMTRQGYEIVDIRSHVDDEDGQGQIFSRDCAEYTIKTPGGKRLVVLINHLKSKGFGSQATSNAKRKRQAARIKTIYDQLVHAGEKFVAVIGDFNDTPDSAPLEPLLKHTNLKDVFVHPSFDDGGRPGTFGTCAKGNKIDYILLSPDLFTRVQGGSVFRMGAWGGTNGTIFPHYPEITRAIEAASDHSAVWAEIDL
jgi:endonuclease/exonuclease/phosphatase family metal-dependent hydrolase